MSNTLVGVNSLPLLKDIYHFLIINKIYIKTSLEHNIAFKILVYEKGTK